jgi:hypothetical protein
MITLKKQFLFKRRISILSLTALSKTIINVDHSSSPTAHLTSVVLTPPPPVPTTFVT